MPVKSRTHLAINQNAKTLNMQLKTTTVYVTRRKRRTM